MVTDSDIYQILSPHIWKNRGEMLVELIRDRKIKPKFEPRISGWLYVFFQQVPLNIRMNSRLKKLVQGGFVEERMLEVMFKEHTSSEEYIEIDGRIADEEKRIKEYLAMISRVGGATEYPEYRLTRNGIGERIVCAQQRYFAINGVLRPA